MSLFSRFHGGLRLYLEFITQPTQGNDKLSIFLQIASKHFDMRVHRTVVAVEIDRALIPVLGETLADYDNVTVIEGDIMKIDLPALFAEHFAGRNVTVCANLPYYITSPILSALLEAE